MKLYSILLLLVLVQFYVQAQDFKIRRVELGPDKLYVHYDLLDTNTAHTYTIALYNSKDNFISALQKVKGDVGLEVRPGANKKIEWNAKDELGADFSEGLISLEVKGRLYIPFIRLDGNYPVMKRSKRYEMTWSGGTQQNILNFDLYQGDKKITSFPNIANVGHYSLTIPNSVKPGKNYRFRISDSKNKDQIVNTASFSIIRRVPLYLKVVPPLILGGAAYFIIKASQPEPLEGPPDPNNIGN